MSTESEKLDHIQAMLRNSLDPSQPAHDQVLKMIVATHQLINTVHGYLGIDTRSFTVLPSKNLKYKPIHELLHYMEGLLYYCVMHMIPQSAGQTLWAEMEPLLHFQGDKRVSYQDIQAHPLSSYLASLHLVTKFFYDLVFEDDDCGGLRNGTYFLWNKYFHLLDATEILLQVEIKTLTSSSTVNLN